MEKIAFCFPGQGSFEAGMGRDIAEAVPQAMDVFRRGSEASGLDLVRLCFEAEADGRLQKGSLVLMTGMGAGLTWGSSLIEWTNGGMIAA